MKFLITIVVVAVVIIIGLIYLYNLNQVNERKNTQEQEFNLAELYISGDWFFSCINETICDVIIRIRNDYNESVKLEALSIAIYTQNKFWEPIGSIMINETVPPEGHIEIHREITGFIASKLYQAYQIIIQGQIIDFKCYILTSIGRTTINLAYIPI